GQSRPLACNLRIANPICDESMVRLGFFGQVWVSLSTGSARYQLGRNGKTAIGRESPCNSEWLTVGPSPEWNLDERGSCIGDRPARGSLLVRDLWRFGRSHPPAIDSGTLQSCGRRPFARCLLRDRHCAQGFLERGVSNPLGKRAARVCDA